MRVVGGKVAKGSLHVVPLPETVAVVADRYDESWIRALDLWTLMMVSK